MVVIQNFLQTLFEKIITDITMKQNHIKWDIYINEVDFRNLPNPLFHKPCI